MFYSTCSNALSGFSQALLQEAHDVEVKKQKVEEKIARQLAFNKEDTATEVTFINDLLLMSVVAYLTCSCVLQETVFKEQVEGLVEEEDDEAAEAANEEEHVAVGAITLSEKKTEKQRKKEKAEKLKVHTFALAT